MVGGALELGSSSDSRAGARTTRSRTAFTLVDLFFWRVCPSALLSLFFCERFPLVCGSEFRHVMTYLRTGFRFIRRRFVGGLYLRTGFRRVMAYIYKRGFDSFAAALAPRLSRQEYWKRGYDEVTTPNVFNMELWEQSGHAQHYRENMFRFDVEGAEFGGWTLKWEQKHKKRCGMYRLCDVNVGLLTGSHTCKHCCFSCRLGRDVR